MKKALFIGSSSEIGVEVIKLLVKKKYHIYCTYFNNIKNIKILKDKNPKLIDLIKFNLKDLRQVKIFIKNIKKKTKKIDLIILGANSSSKRKKFQLLNYSSFHKKILSNFLLNIFLIQFLLKYFLKKNKIKIIHISSLVSKKGSWGLSEYSSSKAALDNVLKCLSYEYKKLDINSIYLEAVKTRGYFLTNKYSKNRKFISSKKAALKIIREI